MPKYAALTAGFFWDTHKLNAFADSQDYVTMTKRINGGTIGLEDRKAHIAHALAVLGG
jgi:putative chitinase